MQGPAGKTLCDLGERAFVAQVVSELFGELSGLFFIEKPIRRDESLEEECFLVDTDQPWTAGMGDLRDFNEEVVAA